MSGNDKDKTVLGGALPGFGGQQPPRRPAPGDGDRTQIGGALPQDGFGGFDRAPSPMGQPQGQPAGGNTWIGGPLPPQQPAPNPGAYPSQIGQAAGANQGFFPEMPSQRPTAPQPMQQPRIALDVALRAKGIGKGGSSNPLVAAASNLLILFGRLRTGLVEMQAQPLMDHVTRELDAYEGNAVQAGADPHEAAVGKYVLCGTADDIVQNLPGAERGIWIQYSMVARFFQKRDSGVGFFMEAEKAMQAPGQRFQLLELMLACLSLGFEGQYRTLPNGAMELARIRAAIYETLRRVKPRPDEDVSVNWTAVPLTGRRKFGGIPVWMVASICALMIMGAYAALTTLLNRDGGAVASTLNTMHPNAKSISILRTGIVEAFVKPDDTTQLDRIRAALQADIDKGALNVGSKGDYIFVRVSNLLLFDSGKAKVKKEFADYAAEIAKMLNGEQGPIKILGFTDNVQMSGRGQFKTNEDLSLARAEGVRDVIVETLTDPARITVEGRGEADPIGDNATAEGQSENRRVEILLAKEGSF